MYYKWIITKKGKKINYKLLRNTPKQLYALQILKKKSIFSYQLDNLNISKIILNKLCNKNLCYVITSTKQLEKKTNDIIYRKISFQLNDHDTSMLEVIFKHKISFLVHVISGASDFLKKEIYLLLSLGILKQGFKVLILVANTYSLYRLQKYIDIALNTSVDVYHSKLSKNDQVLIWTKVSRKKPLILISTHKGILLPFFKLGIIIVDQENDLSYKILGQWKYNVKNVAIVRAYKENIPIVLESSQPSLETLYKIDKKTFRVIYITSQDKKNNLCKVIPYIIDLNKQNIQGLFSITLIQKTCNHLNHNNQVCFVINGLQYMFTLLQCQSCLSVFTCKNCDQFCKYNSFSQELFCDSCVLVIQQPIVCLICGSLHFNFIKYNQDLIKDHIQKIFVDVPVFVISKTRKPFFCEKFKNRTEQKYSNACIIIGTDKLIKECFFHNVTMVAFINVDIFFYSNQFRSIEVFSQIYHSMINCFKIQKLESINMVIQTKKPNNMFLKQLVTQKYQIFASILLQTRKKCNLPPFCCHVTVQAESKKDTYLIVFLLEYANFLKNYSSYTKEKLWIVGPYPVQFNKIYSKFYSRMLLVHSSRLFVKKILNKSLDFFNNFLIKKSIYLTFDVD